MDNKFKKHTVIGDLTGKDIERLVYGPSKPETVIEIVKVTFTFDQVKKFFRKLFHR
jgi:hypothetical protein